MSGISFLSENYADLADVTLTTGTAHAQFPLVNIQNDSPAVRFRSTGNTAVLELDLLQTRDIDTLAVVGDPLSGLGITAGSFKTSTTTDFSSSPIYNLDISGSEAMAFAQITEVSHRYVEVTFTGSGSYVEVGKILIGKVINLPQNSISIGSFSYGRDDNSKTASNDYGQRFIDTLPKLKTLGGTIEFCTKDEQEELDNMFIRHGSSLPVFMLVDPNSDGMNEGKFKLSIYGYFNEISNWSAAGGQLYNVSLEVGQAG